MDDTTRTSIIIAAVTAAGPVPALLDEDGRPVLNTRNKPVLDRAAWSLSVEQLATTITALTAPTSSLSKVVNAVAEAKVFTGTVLGCKKESSSTRGIVTLKTRVSDHHPDGTEVARTERTDNPAGKAMAQMFRNDLVGHKVVVWVQVEQMAGSTNKVRVIRHVEDLGVDDTVTDAELSNAA